MQRMKGVVGGAHAGQDHSLVPALHEMAFDGLERRGGPELCLRLFDGARLVEDVAKVRPLDDAQRLIHSDLLGVRVTVI